MKSSEFDGLVINCPTYGDGTFPPRSVIFNFELDGQKFYNTLSTPLACVCNNYDNNGDGMPDKFDEFNKPVPQPLKECNPEKVYPEEGACPQPVGDKSGAEVTTHVELNNDPYLCSTIGGKRTCYYY